MAFKPTAEYDIKAKDDSKSGIASASANLSSFGKNVGNVFKDIAKISAVGIGAITATALAFNKLTDVYGKQELAVMKLGAASKNNPLIDGKAVKGLMAYASAMQKVTTYGDEAVIPLMSMGVAMGHSEETIKKVTAAAMDLAAGTGMSLDSAFKNLYKTFGGMTGELGESIPALKNLTVEQLKNGDAVAFISKQYAGMAESIANSNSGIKEQTKNIFGDMLESVGKGMAPISNIVMKKLQPVFTNIGKWFEDNSQQITNFFLYFGEIARIVINRVGDGFRKMFTWDWLVKYVSTMFEGLKNIFSSFIKFAVNLVIAYGTTIWLPLAKGFEWIGYGIRVGWQAMINGLAKGINWLVENPVNAIAVAFKTVVNAIGESIQFILNGLIFMINTVIAGLNVVLKGAHDAGQLLKHPVDKSKREAFDGGIKDVANVDIEWLDPKLHKQLTTNLKDWIVDLKEVPKPKEEWDDIAAKIKEVWMKTADSGMDVLSTTLQSMMAGGQILAEPFKEAFAGFSTEFKEILLRELPPEAVNAMDAMLASLADSIPTVKLTKWEVFSNYITDGLKDLGMGIKSIVPKAIDGMEYFSKGFVAAVSNPVEAISDTFDSIKEGVGTAGIALINKIKGVNIETGEKIEKKKDESSIFDSIGSALLNFGGWLLDMAMSTQALTDVFSFLADTLGSMFESIIVPIANALMPIVNLLLSFAAEAMNILMPVIDAIASLFIALTSPLTEILETVLTMLKPVIDVLVQAFGIVSDLLIQIMPVIQTVLDAVATILAPVISFISSLLNSLAPVFKMIGDVLLAIAPIIEAIGYLIGSILAPVLQFLSDLIGAILTPVINVLSNILVVLTPVIQIIANLMKALAPLFNVLGTVLSVLLIPLQIFGSLLSLLNPIFTILAAVIDFLNPVIVVFAKILDAATRPIEFVGDLLMWLGNGLKALGQAIWYLITFQWTKMGDIKWPAAFESDAFNRPLIDITDIKQPTIDLGDPATSPQAAETTGYSGTGATYGTNNLTINVQINTDVIAGEDGIRGLAMIINNEIESLRTQGVA